MPAQDRKARPCSTAKSIRLRVSNSFTHSAFILVKTRCPINIEEVDVGLNQKPNDLVSSSQWRPSIRLGRLPAAKLCMVLPVLAICVALCVSCFANGRLFMGLWLVATFLSWAFLLGAAYATDQSSCALKNDDESRGRAWIGAEYGKKISLSRAAGKSVSAPAAWKGETMRRVEQG
jgi:hypothetical protein